MASQGPPAGEPITFCANCGKPIEADARFCRFCGRAQGDRAATGHSSGARTAIAPRTTGRTSGPRAADGLEQRLRQLFPRHPLQDELMHIGTIAAFFMLVIGFILGFFQVWSWLAQNFLLAGIGLLLFLILREATLGQLRERGPASPNRRPEPGPDKDVPAEAATMQSSPARPAPPPPPPPPPPRPPRQ